MRNRRAQVAMEFLMTYGWAILIVLVVISALAYFGVLNPQQFLPRKCQFGQGLVCMDHRLSSYERNLILILNNGIGRDLRVEGLDFSSDNGLVACINNTLDEVLQAGGNLYLLVGCTVNAAPATRIKGNLLLNYTDLQFGLNHMISGTLFTNLE
ncbi:MAG: hypothetical protein ABH879_03315 [archaeon]